MKYRNTGENAEVAEKDYTFREFRVLTSALSAFSPAFRSRFNDNRRLVEFAEMMTRKSRKEIMLPVDFV
jgi:hypothetical protein